MPIATCEHLVSLSPTMFLVASICVRKRLLIWRNQLTRRAKASFDERLSADDHDHEQLVVPVRHGAHTVVLKRYMDRDGLLRAVKLGLRPPPAVLLIHDGPGLPSRYLEPLSARLRPSGRTCYMYDQLGCGLSKTTSEPEEGFGLQQSVEELFAVLEHLRVSLGEERVHLVAHGFGGAVVMEALLRSRSTWSNKCEALPMLASICLLGVPSCTKVADEESRSLMNEAVNTVGIDDAARAFWYRHVCALSPQPACLSEAYSQGTDGPSSKWRGFAALRGWDWQRDPSVSEGGFWNLRGSGVLEDWAVSRAEVSDAYRFRADDPDLPRPPLLSLRGQHDFVTARCVEAWKGVKDVLDESSDDSKPTFVFREEVIGGCGHNAHLENPEAVSARIRLWFLEVEDQKRKSTSSHSIASREEDVVSRSNYEYQFLARSEARKQLADWASALSWDTMRGKRVKPGQWRSVGQGLPHRDHFAPSRTMRQLAEWAWNLPSSLPVVGLAFSQKNRSHFYSPQYA